MQNLKEVFYSSKHYDVVRVNSPLKDEVREKYGILNKKNHMIEYYIDTFDNATIAAETLSYIIDNGTWRNQVEANIEMIKRDSGAGGIAHNPMAVSH